MGGCAHAFLRLENEGRETLERRSQTGAVSVEHPAAVCKYRSSSQILVTSAAGHSERCSFASCTQDGVLIKLFFPGEEGRLKLPAVRNLAAFGCLVGLFDQRILQTVRISYSSLMCHVLCVVVPRSFLRRAAGCLHVICAQTRYLSLKTCRRIAKFRYASGSLVAKKEREQPRAPTDTLTPRLLSFESHDRLTYSSLFWSQFYQNQFEIEAAQPRPAAEVNCIYNKSERSPHACGVGLHVRTVRRPLCVNPYIMLAVSTIQRR